MTTHNLIGQTQLENNVFENFLELLQALTHLNVAILNEADLISWAQDMPTLLFNKGKESAREKAVAVINQLHYLDNQAPREILICAGFVGASPSTLNLIVKVNECKDAFKRAVILLKKSKISIDDDIFIEKIDKIYTQSSTNALQRMGLARLHLKQCYRKIPVLKEVPIKISWTWAHTRAIKKITLARAEELLMKRGNDVGIQLQLQKLSHLSPHEPLAIVQELAPHLRANVVFSEKNFQRRMMIKGPIPIFFPCLPQTAFPTFSPPREKCEKNHQRSIRKDVKLEPTPFLPAIRAHRYVVCTK